MPELPFKIPESLAIYVEQFENDPVKVTTKLKNHLSKRGTDAVGYFLLAWFYHLKGLKDQAIEYSLKAKTYAPGSPLMEHLHYYLSHPDTFDAWVPSAGKPGKDKPFGPGHGHAPVLDLDSLIEKLSEVESQKITPESNAVSGGTTDSDLEYDVDDIVSETLANIHETQGKTEAAIRTYKRLKKLNKEKKEYYKEQISRLKKLREEQDEDEDD